MATKSINVNNRFCECRKLGYMLTRQVQHLLKVRDSKNPAKAIGNAVIVAFQAFYFSLLPTMTSPPSSPLTSPSNRHMTDYKAAYLSYLNTTLSASSLLDLQRQAAAALLDATQSEADESWLEEEAAKQMVSPSPPPPPAVRYPRWEGGGPALPVTVSLLPLASLQHDIAELKRDLNSVKLETVNRLKGMEIEVALGVKRVLLFGLRVELRGLEERLEGEEQRSIVVGTSIEEVVGGRTQIIRASSAASSSIDSLNAGLMQVVDSSPLKTTTDNERKTVAQKLDDVAPDSSSSVIL
jgi:hypothetical protein